MPTPRSRQSGRRCGCPPWREWRRSRTACWRGASPSRRISPSPPTAPPSPLTSNPRARPRRRRGRCSRRPRRRAGACRGRSARRPTGSLSTGPGGCPSPNWSRTRRVSIRPIRRCCAAPLRPSARASSRPGRRCASPGSTCPPRSMAACSSPGTFAYPTCSMPRSATPRAGKASWALTIRARRRACRGSCGWSRDPTGSRQ